MLKALSQIWRLIFTGLSFALFGLGGLVLGILVFPWFLWMQHVKRRQWLARRVIQYAFKTFIGFMRFFRVLSYETHGFDRLKNIQGKLVIANHPTLLDTVFLMSFFGGIECIVKAPLFINPFTRGPVKAAGYIPNRGDADAMVQECINRLKNGSNVLIFPEGTRTVDVSAHRLQRGAANVAVRGGVNLLPIHIICTPSTLRKGEKWYNIPPRKAHFCFIFKDEIDIEPYLSDNPSLGTRRLNESLTRLFNEYTKTTPNTEGISHV